MFSEALDAYLDAHATPLEPLLQENYEETYASLSSPQMIAGPVVGRLLRFLVAMTAPRLVLEIGTFTGYSALCIARGLPADGHLLCCDVSEEWTSVGRRAWADAGVADKIELVIAPAADTLRALPNEEYLDLAFIDADKPSYPVYYEELLRRLRPSGLIMVDNTLWGGAIIDESVDDESTLALRAFNDMVAADARVDATILTLGDGLTMLRKR